MCQLFSVARGGGGGGDDGDDDTAAVNNNNNSKHLQCNVCMYPSVFLLRQDDFVTICQGLNKLKPGLVTLVLAMWPTINNARAHVPSTNLVFNESVIKMNAKHQKM